MPTVEIRDVSLTFDRNTGNVRTYIFFTDPGHGWLKVAKSELTDLGIQDQISTCSYQRGDCAYLEEDCDAELFLRTLRKQGIDFSIKESNCNNHSRIRSYDYYEV